MRAGKIKIDKLELSGLKIGQASLKGRIIGFVSYLYEYNESKARLILLEEKFNSRWWN